MPVNAYKKCDLVVRLLDEDIRDAGSSLHYVMEPFTDPQPGLLHRVVVGEGDQEETEEHR